MISVMAEPLVYRDPHRKRILWIGILIAVLILGFIATATVYTSKISAKSGAFTGKVIAKEFTPAPAQEITIGRGGLVSQHVEGEYLLKVQRPESPQIFNVWVGKAEYDEFNVGDDYYVVPTP